MENNKKLLTKIQQLEETEADAQQQITALQRENERVGTQVDSLTSTVTSQSSLIVGLRKMVSDLNVRVHFDECRI
jgi:peptidoglycan hydrolase CwlO-like protein